MTDIDTSVDSGTAAASDDPLVDQVHRHYNEAFDHSKEWREKARQDYDFYVGEQWDADDKLALEGQDRPIITFNYIQMIVDAVVGVEINNRQESRYIPRELGDVKINEIYSGVASHAEDEGDTEDEESDAFQDLVICGMGWTETRMSYDFDPMGDLIPSERFDPLEGYWDPTARKKNIVDSRWRLRIKAMDRKEAEAVWPKIKDIAGEATGAPWDRQADTATGEPREHIYPQDAYELSKDQSRQHQKNRNIIRVGQYQWVEFEPVMIVHNEIKGEIETLTMEQWGKVKAIVEEAGWKHLRQRQKRFKQCFVAGRLLLEEGQCPDPEFFTLHCMTGQARPQQELLVWPGPQFAVAAALDQQVHVADLGVHRQERQRWPHGRERRLRGRPQGRGGMVTPR